MNYKLNKEQIAEVTAIFTELCEKIADRKISFNLGVRKTVMGSGEVRFTYDVYAIYKDKLTYIKMGDYHSLMDTPITSVDVEAIITLLKGDK